jgi:hypothetical protein
MAENTQDVEVISGLRSAVPLHAPGFACVMACVLGVFASCEWGTCVSGGLGCCSRWALFVFPAGVIVAVAAAAFAWRCVWMLPQFVSPQSRRHAC